MAAPFCNLTQPLSIDARRVHAFNHRQPWRLASNYRPPWGTVQYVEAAGRNHYQLIAFLANVVASACEAAGQAPTRFCDIGTNHGDSVRAWRTGAPSAEIDSFDLRDSEKHFAQMRVR